MDFWSNGCAKLGQNGLNSLSYHPLLPRPQMDLLMFGEVAQLCRMLLKSVPLLFILRILHNCTRLVQVRSLAISPIAESGASSLAALRSDQPVHGQRAPMRAHPRPPAVSRDAYMTTIDPLCGKVRAARAISSVVTSTCRSMRRRLRRPATRHQRARSARWRSGTFSDVTRARAERAPRRAAASTARCRTPSFASSEADYNLKTNGVKLAR